MLTFLPAPILGCIAMTLYALNTLLISLVALLLFVIGLILPIRSWRQFFNELIHEIVPTSWALTNNFTMWLTTKTQWEIHGSGELNKEGWHLLICNHRSWLDIIVLEKVFAHKIPMLKFFMKRELLWTLPVAGVVCWVLGFPFVQRYSKEDLKKHPEKAGKDLEVTKQLCEKFKNEPMTVANYVEGGRYNEERHQSQASPYKYLLKPKAGGFAFVLAVMQGHLNTIINTTIIYPDPQTSLWRFCCGKIKKIIVHYEVIPIDAKLIGDYQSDKQHRVYVQQWLNKLWYEKDELIEKFLQQEKT
jgi:1-acyl-sn-glycerol-3-phosphate acyltransferase